MSVADLIKTTIDADENGIVSVQSNLILHCQEELSDRLIRETSINVLSLAEHKTRSLILSKLYGDIENMLDELEDCLYDCDTNRLEGIIRQLKYYCEKGE